MERYGAILPLFLEGVGTGGARLLTHYELKETVERRDGDKSSE